MNPQTVAGQAVLLEVALRLPVAVQPEGLLVELVKVEPVKVEAVAVAEVAVEMGVLGAGTAMTEVQLLLAMQEC